MKKVLGVLVLVTMMATPVVHAAVFYVSPAGNDGNPGTKTEPFGTLAGARDAVRALKDEGLKEDITVWIRGGTYQLTETVVFGLKDSAPKGHTVRYAAYGNENPIFTSGVKISAWKKLKNAPDALPENAKGKVWTANLNRSLGDVWKFRTLFDGETMLPRARSAGFNPTNPRVKRELRWTDLDTFHFPKGTIRNWDNLDDVEIFVRPNHVWIVNYLTLGSVDEKKLVAKTTVPATYNITAGGAHGDPNCWVENVLEVLDKPGEWVLNSKTGTLYLWPTGKRPGPDITVPRLRELVRVEGKNVDALDGDVPVRGIEFKGLTLTCGDRDVWTREDKGIQHDWEMWDKDNSLLRFRGAEDCALIDCELRNSGGGGVRIDRFGQRINIRGNNIHNLGGTALLLCGYGPGLKDVNKDNVVSNNNIQTCSQLHWHNPGIFVWQSGSNRILNNRIHDLPYDGIVLSGVRPRFFGITDPVKWTESDIIPADIRENMLLIRKKEVGQPQNAAEARVFAHAVDNLVMDNEVNDVMQTLGDGNCIYLSCAGEGNIVRRNFVYNYPARGQTIRFDDDQEESIVDQNIVFGPGIALKHNNYIFNNVIIGGEIVFKKETEPGCSVRHNIVYRTTDPTFFAKSGRTNRGWEKANSDLNVFYYTDIDAAEKVVQRFRDDFGMDKNSIVVDPGFVDLDRYDVRLKPDSPARKLGISSIDIDKIGLIDDPAFRRVRKQGLVSTGTGSKLAEH